MTLKPGDKAPSFELRNQNGELFSNANLKGKFLVLFFYPKDNTPGCTAEACSFRDNMSKFKKLNAEVWGVSADKEASHNLFAKKYNLPFPILTDRDNKLRTTFGVQKTLGFLPGRVTYIIDKQGTIFHVFNNLLDGPAHVQDALLAIENFQG